MTPPTPRRSVGERGLRRQFADQAQLVVQRRPPLNLWENVRLLSQKADEGYNDALATPSAPAEHPRRARPPPERAQRAGGHEETGTVAVAFGLGYSAASQTHERFLRVLQRDSATD